MGDRVKFWTYRWCGDLPLQLSFPVVYGIATNRETSMASSIEQLGIGARRSWNVRLITEPNDWELGVVDEFLRTLGSNLPQSKNRDRMRWKLTKKGDFDIRSFYNKLQNHLPIIKKITCLLSFLGKVFGRLRLLCASLSLFGLQLGIRFLQAIICGVEALILLIGALCVVVMERR